MRKIVEFDDNTLAALKLLASDRMSSLQELADEAFADLLRKHHRPTETREALKMSLEHAGPKWKPARPLNTRPSDKPGSAGKPAKRRPEPASRAAGRKPR